MRARLVSLCLAGALACAAVAPPAGARSKPLRYSGSGCNEIQATIAVPLERIERFVPEPFEIAATAGMAQVYVGFVACEVLQIQGRPGRPGTVSEVGVQIASPESGGGSHVYSLWQVNDRADLRRGLQKLGMGGARVNMTYDVAHPAPGVTETVATVPWAVAGYSTQARGIEPLRPIGSVGSTWWHSGRKGPLRIDYLLPDLEAAAAVGSLEVEEGSPLHEITGGSIPQLPLLVYRFDFTAGARRAAPRS